MCNMYTYAIIIGSMDEFDIYASASTYKSKYSVELSDNDEEVIDMSTFPVYKSKGQQNKRRKGNSTVIASKSDQIQSDDSDEIEIITVDESAKVRQNFLYFSFSL